MRAVVYNRPYNIFDMRKGTKYNVSKSTSDRILNGIVFDSGLEMRYYRDVILPRLESGEISYCERQKKYVLQPSFIYKNNKVLAIEYKADFYIIDKDGNETVIDIKGYPDTTAILKRKMFWYAYPTLNYIWVGYSNLDGGWVTYEVIKAGRRERKKKIKQKSKELKDKNEKI